MIKAGDRIFLIIGENRAEFCRPKKKDIDVKHFFVTRNQMYKGYPEQFAQCVHTFHGHFVEDTEMIVYAENGIRPHVEMGIPTNMDKLLADIDEHRSVKLRDSPKKMFGMLKAPSKDQLV